MRNLILLLLSSCLITACASSEKLAKPKGDWQPVNKSGFIPDGVAKYTKDSKEGGVYNVVP